MSIADWFLPDGICEGARLFWVLEEFRDALWQSGRCGGSRTRRPYGLCLTQVLWVRLERAGHALSDRGRGCLALRICYPARDRLKPVNLGQTQGSDPLALLLIARSVFSGFLR